MIWKNKLLCPIFTWLCEHNLAECANQPCLPMIDNEMLKSTLSIDNYLENTGQILENEEVGKLMEKLSSNTTDSSQVSW